MEIVVRPMRLNDQTLIARYEGFFVLPSVRLQPISPAILRVAARLRATVPKLRTPDAIHAATAIASGAGLFISNDFGFRQVPGLPVEVLGRICFVALPVKGWPL